VRVFVNNQILDIGDFLLDLKQVFKFEKFTQKLVRFIDNLL